MSRSPDPDRVTAAHREFRVGKRLVGDAHPCLIVGEVAQAHEGSLGMAHAFIDAIADAGADAVKFQTHVAAAESTSAEPFRVTSPGQDASRYAYWRRMEFAPAQWEALFRHAEARGLILLSSPFSAEAVAMLSACGMQAWKVGSGELCHLALVEQVARTRRPVILSSGMGSWDEISRAVDCVRAEGAPVGVLQCTSKYPVPPEDVGVQCIPLIRTRFDCVAGLSDHSGTVYPALVAAAFGASIAEVHVTLSREMYGPDVTASVTTAELRDLVRGVRFVERMMARVPDKDALAGELAPMRAAFFRSIVARHALPVGTVLRAEHLVLKKPGTGLPPERLPEVIGRILQRPLSEDAPLQPEDLAPFAPSTPDDGPRRPRRGTTSDHADAARARARGRMIET